MPKAKPTSKAKPTPKAKPADPDRLVRQAAGTYRTEDDRFEVRDGGTGWFLVDTAQANDFGQELILGPYATLAAVREAIPPARSAKVTPIRPPATPGRDRGKPTKAGTNAKAAASAKAAAPAPPKPQSWIDRLPKGDATAVRDRIAALEAAGTRGAEAIVRRDREGIGPEVATRLIQARLEEIVAELPEQGRAGARELVRRAAEVLTADGTTRRRGLPGWTLVELDADGEPPNRRIIIRELPE
jgi:hypothetical protein